MRPVEKHLRRLGGVLTAAAAIIALASPAAVAVTPIVGNGDFEYPVVEPGNFQTFNAGSHIGHWRVATGSIDIVGDFTPTGPFGWHPASGVQSIDLSGNNPGSIVQHLATVPGQVYTLRFAFAGNPAGGPRVKRMGISWDHTSLGRLSFDVTGHTLESVGWEYHEYSVTATTTLTQLRFRAAKHQSFCGPVLDDVSVTPAA
jgi:choice-of-anchor C domain-containing protein